MKNWLWILLLVPIFWQSCSDNKAQPGTAAADEDAVKPDTPLVIREIVGIARIEPPEKIITINTETPGYVREINYKENQPIQKGEVLLILDSDVEQAQLRQAKSGLQTQRAAIKSAQATLEALQVQLANAKNTYQRNQRLASGKALTDQELDDSRFAVENLEKQMVAQEAVITQQQNRLQELEAEVNYYQTLLSDRTIRAPLSGMFLSSNVKPGNYITTSTSLGDFAVDGPYQAITEVDELFATKVKLGQSAYIRLQGSSEKLASGKVVYMAPYLKQKSLFSDSPDNLEDRRVREVRVELDSKENILIGSRVECVIQIEK